MNENALQVALSEFEEKICTITPKGEILIDSASEEISCTEADILDFSSSDSRITNAGTIYKVFRYLYDSQHLSNIGLKFDLTLLTTTHVFDELPRTRGHYHMVSESHGAPFFDVYQVLAGHTVIQVHEKPAEASEVFLIHATANDVLFLPPWHCHVMYNVGEEPLLVANWCTRSPHLDYAAMRETRGPALQLLSFSPGRISAKPNRTFGGSSLPVRHVKACTLPDLKLQFSLYSNLIFDWQYNPSFVGFMNNPCNGKDFISTFFEPKKDSATDWSL